MAFVDPECAAIAATWRRRDLRARLPDSISARDPMYRRSGASYDLKSIREYQPFDDPRAIDWKLFGRTDRAFVKEFYDEADDEIALLIDTSGSMSTIPREEYLTCIGSLSYILLALGLGVRLWSFSGSLSGASAAARGSGGHANLGRMLSALVFKGESATTRSFNQWKTRGRQRWVIVFSDFHEPELALRAPHSGTLFMIRYRTPLGSLAERGSELEVRDPESDLLAVVPWSKADDDAWQAEERLREAKLAAMPRTYFARLDAGSPRVPVYWNILERLYA